MHSQIDSILSHEPVNAFIHFGAGLCREIDAHLSLQPNLLLLVEADPDLSNSLLERCNDNAQILVNNSAISDHSSSATLYRFNLPDLNSLRRPTDALLEQFPGLQTIDKINVGTVKPSTVLQPLTLDSEDNNILLIDTPGEEMAVLKSLANDNLIHSFQYIQVFCTNQILYENSMPSSKILKYISDVGFDLIYQDVSDDPDRPLFILKRNQMLLQNIRLQHEIDELVIGKDKLASIISDLNKRIEALTADRESKLNAMSDKEDQLIQIKAALEESSKVAEERLATIKNITSEKNELAYRQLILDEELVKAEAQIKLINDILIREKLF